MYSLYRMSRSQEHVMQLATALLCILERTTTIAKAIETMLKSNALAALAEVFDMHEDDDEVLCSTCWLVAHVFQRECLVKTCGCDSIQRGNSFNCVQQTALLWP